MKNFLLFLCIFYLQCVSADQHPKVTAECIEEKLSMPPYVCFYLEDFPKNEKVTFYVYRPMVEEAKMLQSFVIDQEGVIHSNGLEQKFVALSAVGFFQGERVWFCFKVKDEIIASLFCIPHPILVKNHEDSLSIKAQLLVQKPAVYRLVINGLEEGEKTTLISRSCHEILKESMTFSKDRILTLSPDVVDKRGGVARVSIQAKNKQITIELPWGKEIQRCADRKRRINTVSKKHS